ncbi:MAG: hypothetical protein WD200_02015 [Candidatus Andersenbacteria bacterium]
MVKVRFYTTTKEGYKQLLAWGGALMTTRKDEALRSMLKEDVEFEGMYLAKTAKIPYLVVAFMYSPHEIKYPDMSMSVNQEHRTMKDRWLKPAKGHWSMTELDNLSLIYELETEDYR